MTNLKHVLLSAFAAIGIGVVHHQDANEIIDGNQNGADRNIPSAYLQNQGCDTTLLEKGKGYAQCPPEGSSLEHK